MTLDHRHVVRGGLQRCQDDDPVMGEMEYTADEMEEKDVQETDMRVRREGREYCISRLKKHEAPHWMQQVSCRTHLGGANRRARKCIREREDMFRGQ